MIMAALVKSVYPLQSGEHSGHTFIDIFVSLGHRLIRIYSREKHLEILKRTVRTVNSKD